MKKENKDYFNKYFVISKKMKKQNGITLIALVITVVIMLILAGVAIAAVVDGDGLFSKTREAVEIYQNAAMKEAEQMQTLMNEINEYLTGESGNDTTSPTNVTIESSNVEETTFTLTATGTDGESGVAKYEFYLNGALEKTVETTSGTATYNVTGKTANTSYTCKVRVYDNAGNYMESSEIKVVTMKERYYLVKDGKQLDKEFWPKKATIDTSVEDSVSVETFYAPERAGIWIDIDVTGYKKLYMDAEINYLHPLAGIATVLLLPTEDLDTSMGLTQIGWASGAAAPRTERSVDISNYTGTIRLFMMKNATAGNSNAVFKIYNLWLEK